MIWPSSTHSPHWIRFSQMVRKILRWSLVAVLVLLLSVLGLWKLSSSRHYQVFGQLVTRVDTPHKQVALTFDDGPMPDYTEAMIQLLAQHQIKATFFVTGAESEQHPQAAQQLVEAGHELGNHSYSHRRMVFTAPNKTCTLKSKLR